VGLEGYLLRKLWALIRTGICSLRCIGKTELLRQVGITLVLWNNAFSSNWENRGKRVSQHNVCDHRLCGRADTRQERISDAGIHTLLAGPVLARKRFSQSRHHDKLCNSVGLFWVIANILQYNSDYLTVLDIVWATKHLGRFLPHL